MSKDPSSDGPKGPSTDGRRGALLLFVLLGILMSAAKLALAQNPLPFINQPLVPVSVAAGGPDFTLTVNGAGFVSGATVNWNGSPLATTFVSSSQLTATIPAANIAFGGSASITVVDPAPGGGVSNAVFLPVVVQPAAAFALGSPVQIQSFYLPSPPIVAADFNGDGKLDLADACDGICVMMGRGNGAFDPPYTDYVPSANKGIVAGDFNGDGRPDLVVSNQTAGLVSLFLGNGNGTFQPHVDSPAGQDPVALAAGDFNKDGKLDLAVTNLVNPNGACLISILLGNGDGTFQPPAGNTVGKAPVSITAGDFNLDGNLDLAAADQYSHAVSVLLGNGDGTFQNDVQYAAAGSLEELTHSILAADFNGDGVPDLAATSRGGTIGTLIVLLGNGDGTFQPGVKYSAGSGAGTLVSGDFDADGILDLAVRTSGGTGSSRRIAILAGNGDGTFQAHADYPTGIQASSLVAGDFNGDGLPDFAMPTDANVTNIFVQLQTVPVQLAPLTAGFGNQAVGTTSAITTFVLVNNTASPVTVSDIALSGPNAGEFPHGFHCPVAPDTLGPGESCRLNVNFTPTALGGATATLTVTESDPAGSQTAGLSGTGIQPAAVLSPTSLDFGTQNVDTASAPKGIVLTNSGIGPLTINGILASDDYSQTNNCGVSVAEGASCAINVTFAPAGGGARPGTLTVTDNAADSPQTVTLSGTGVAPTVTISPTSLDFGSQPVSVATAVQVLTLTNNGPGPLTVTGVSIGGTSSGDFAQTNTCLGTVSFPGNCSISVTFTPTVSGARPATLYVYDNTADSPQSVALSGTGVPPTVTISPTSLDFGSVMNGSTSSAQTVTLTNNGPGPLTVNSVSFSGASPGDFAYTNNCFSAVSFPGSCTISVTFKPTTGGARPATLFVYDNAADSPQSVALSGTGIPPTVTISPTSLDFGSQPVSVATAAQVVTVTNNGPGPLSVNYFSIAGADRNDFTVNTTCSGSISYPGSCTVSVTFTPTAGGARSAAFLLYDNAADSPQTINLSGNGVAPTVSLSATSLDFGSVMNGSTSSAQTVTLTNNGPGPLAVSAIGIGGAASGDFTRATTCPSSLSFPGSCTISVTFTPLAGGSRSATLYINDNAGDSQQTVSLSGTGIGPTVTVTPTSIDFGSQPLGVQTSPQTVTVTNNGPGPLNMSVYSFSSGFQFNNHCPQSVPQAGQCTVDVYFQPGNPGTVFGILNISDNAADSPQQVSLKGTGVAPTITVSPASLTFAPQLVNTTSAPQMVTIANSGPGPLIINSLYKTTYNFSYQSNCPGSLAALASCTISVYFRPLGNGDLADQIKIEDNGIGNPHYIVLKGTGLGPSSSLSPSTLHFSGQLLGTTSAPQTVTLTNIGGGAMTLTGILMSGPFAETNNCAATLAAGASCTIQVTFTPTGTGDTYGTVKVTSDSPQDATTYLYGTGTAFTVSAAQPSASVSAGGTATYTLAVETVSGFNQPITFGCVGAPQFSQCTVSPNPVVPSGTGPATATVSVATTASSMLAPNLRIAPRRPGPSAPSAFQISNFKSPIPFGPIALPESGILNLESPITYPPLAAALLLVLVLVFLAVGRPWVPIRVSRIPAFFTRLPISCFLLPLFLAAVLLTWSSCGGGGTSNVVTRPGTPAGTYTLTVTARTSSGATTLTHTITLNLKVN